MKIIIFQCSKNLPHSNTCNQVKSFTKHGRPDQSQRELTVALIALLVTYPPSSFDISYCFSPTFWQLLGDQQSTGHIKLLIAFNRYIAIQLFQWSWRLILTIVTAHKWTSLCFTIGRTVIVPNTKLW